MVKITIDTSILPMICSDSNYRGNAMVDMEKCHNPRKYSNLEFYRSYRCYQRFPFTFFTTATSSLPLNFTSLLPLIYHGSTVAQGGNLKYRG